MTFTVEATEGNTPVRQEECHGITGDAGLRLRSVKSSGFKK